MPWRHEHWQGVMRQQLDAVQDVNRMLCQFHSVAHKVTFFVLKPRCV